MNWKMLAGVIVLLVVIVAAFVIGRSSARDDVQTASSAVATTVADGGGGSEGTEEAVGPSSTSTAPPSGQVPTEPLASGAGLSRLITPPADTLWAFAAEAYESGVRILVGFEPYGYGPETYGPSVVARITEATAAEAGQEIPELLGKNVVLLLGRSSVKEGGSYTGIVVTEARDDRVILVLEEAELKKGH